MTCVLGHGHCKRGDEIAPGDIILFCGPHLVSKVVPTPPDYPLPAIIGHARSVDGWGIALEADVCVEVAS